MGVTQKFKTLSGKSPKPYNWEELLCHFLQVHYFKISTTVMMMSENQTLEEKHPKIFLHAARSDTLEFVPLAPFWGCLNFFLIRNIGIHSIGFLLDPFELNWNLHLWGCGWKGCMGEGGGCVCEKHSLGCGRGLAAGRTGSLLWSGHSGRGLWGPDWGSANRMFLCWPHLGRTLRIS